jgi:low temperature requirement protein LtrA
VVGPLELFYDLAVVVLVAQAAHHLAEHLTWPGLGEFAAVFTLVWIAWANGSLHHELHGHDDARARSTFLLQILLLVAMAAFIPEAGGERGAAFAVAAGVLFAVLTVLWLLAARGDRPQYRRTSMLFVTGTAGCAIALAATALLPARARVLAWGLIDAAYLAGFAAVILTVAPTRAASAPGGPISTSPDNVGPGRNRCPPCNGYSAICRLRALSPQWAPRWSASSTTPMTAEPQRPRRGC